MLSMALTFFLRPAQHHLSRRGYDWVSASHTPSCHPRLDVGTPRIMLPLLVFILGSITYTVSVFKILLDMISDDHIDIWPYSCFDRRQNDWLVWLSKVQDLSLAARKYDGSTERLSFHYCSTFYHWKWVERTKRCRGSYQCLSCWLTESRKRLIIDCREFQSTAFKSQLVSALAAQTGY